MAEWRARQLCLFLFIFNEFSIHLIIQMNMYENENYFLSPLIGIHLVRVLMFKIHKSKPCNKRWQASWIEIICDIYKIEYWTFCVRACVFVAWVNSHPKTMNQWHVGPRRHNKSKSTHQTNILIKLKPNISKPKYNFSLYCVFINNKCYCCFILYIFLFIFSVAKNSFHWEDRFIFKIKFQREISNILSCGFVLKQPKYK